MTGTATHKPRRHRTKSVHYVPSRDQSKRPERVLLQQNASRNIRRHWLRGVFRVAVLITTDVAVLMVLRGILEAVTESGVAASSVAEFARAVLPQEFLAGWPFTFAAVLSLLVVGSYGPGDRRRDVGRLMTASGLAAALTVYHLIWLESLLAVSLSFGAVTMLCWMVLTASRRTLDALQKWLVPSVGAHRVVTVCDGGSDWLDPSMQNMGGGMGGSSLRVVGTVSTSRVASDDDGAPLRQLGAVIDRCKADTVLVCGPLSDDQFRFVVDTALVSGCRLLTAPRTAGTAGIQPRSVWLQGVPLVELTAPALKGQHLLVKRVIDIAGAFIGLTLMLPIMAIVAVAIKLDSAGPVFFSQERVGYGARVFRLFKFRTMWDGADADKSVVAHLNQSGDARLFKIKDDPRVTRLGGWLRRWSIDELPQLWNVLCGSMSLVGPRPFFETDLDEYLDHHFVRLGAKPGITGLWQVNGRSTLVDFEDVVRLDTEYINGWSLLVDLKVILLTIPAVLRKSGAY